jgi:hypothetical protein
MAARMADLLEMNSHVRMIGTNWLGVDFYQRKPLPDVRFHEQLLARWERIFIVRRWTSMEQARAERTHTSRAQSGEWTWMMSVLCISFEPGQGAQALRCNQAVS